MQPRRWLGIVLTSSDGALTATYSVGTLGGCICWGAPELYAPVSGSRRTEVPREEERVLLLEAARSVLGCVDTANLDGIRGLDHQGELADHEVRRLLADLLVILHPFKGKRMHQTVTLQCRLLDSAKSVAVKSVTFCTSGFPREWIGPFLTDDGTPCTLVFASDAAVFASAALRFIRTGIDEAVYEPQCVDATEPHGGARRLLLSFILKLARIALHPDASLIRIVDQERLFYLMMHEACQRLCRPPLHGAHGQQQQQQQQISLYVPPVRRPPVHRPDAGYELRGDSCARHFTLKLYSNGTGAVANTAVYFKSGGTRTRPSIGGPVTVDGRGRIAKCELGLFTLAMMRCLEDIHFDGPLAFLRSVGLDGLDGLEGLEGLLSLLHQAHADLVASVEKNQAGKKRKR